jgi:hypothetical protein
LARKPIPGEKWYPDVADMIVRRGLSVRRAAEACGVELTQEEAENHERRKSFERAKWDAEHKYAAEIGANPDWNKTVLIGEMRIIATKLRELGEYKQAADVLFSLAKITGDVGPDVQTNVFEGLSARDLEDIREKLKRGKVAESTGAGPEPIPN